jgi:hypothetical protein
MPGCTESSQFSRKHAHKEEKIEVIIPPSEILNTHRAGTRGPEVGYSSSLHSLNSLITKLQKLDKSHCNTYLRLIQAHKDTNTNTTMEPSNQDARGKVHAETKQIIFDTEKGIDQN